MNERRGQHTNSDATEGFWHRVPSLRTLPITLNPMGDRFWKPKETKAREKGAKRASRARRRPQGQRHLLSKNRQTRGARTQDRAQTHTKYAGVFQKPRKRSQRPQIRHSGIQTPHHTFQFQRTRTLTTGLRQTDASRSWTVPAAASRAQRRLKVAGAFSHIEANEPTANLEEYSALSARTSRVDAPREHCRPQSASRKKS